MSKRKLYYMLSPRLRRFARRMYFLPIDFYEKVTGKRDSITPPKGKIYIGSGDFLAQGRRLLDMLIKHGKIKPNHRVLDVGCGIGRVAIPLTNYLSSEGSYEGFDIVKDGIKWCERKISPNHQNFNFVHINLKNNLYNLSTKQEAKNFEFPYQNNEFDLVFLFSVFTHMLPEDVDSYLGQIARVLKKGGVCLATFFVYNKESERLMRQNDGLQFKYDLGNYLLIDKKVKEANVAFREDFLKELVSKNGLKIDGFHYGYWPGRSKTESVDFQDVLILSKV